MFKKTRIVYMGTPEFAVAPLDALRKNGYVNVKTYPPSLVGLVLSMASLLLMDHEFWAHMIAYRLSGQSYM